MLDDDAAALNSKKQMFFFIYVELKLTILNSVGQLFPDVCIVLAHKVSENWYTWQNMMLTALFLSGLFYLENMYLFNSLAKRYSGAEDYV